MVSAIAVRLQEVTVRFGRVPAVDNLSLAVHPGEILALLGPSGCGKTTTLRAISGILRPDRGEVFFDEQRITDLPPHRRNVGMVFQNYALFPHLTVRGNVLFGLEMRRAPADEREERVRRVLEMLRIANLAHAFPDQLSGGQQQRVALARTLVVEPAVLLLDEPLSALDRQLRDAMRGELRSLLKQIGITTVIVTHDQEEALTLADRVVVMRGGRIEQIGAPREIYHNPQSHFVASFIGQTNYLPGEIVALDTAGARVRIAEGLEVRTRTANGHFVGARVDVAVRPEAISFALPDAPEPAISNRLPARLLREVFVGGMTQYACEVVGGVQVVVARASGTGSASSAPTADETGRVLLCWLPESSIVLEPEPSMGSVEGGR